MLRRRVLVALGGAASFQPVLAQAPTTAAPAEPTARIGEIKPLGRERFLIGRIVVDKRARRFTVPGWVQALDKPLEYLATTPTGRKAYESLLALDASGSEVNLACILIGLERDPKVPPSKPLTQGGQPVLLWVAWTDPAGQRRRLTATEALFGAEAVSKGTSVEWGYTGSFTSIDGSQLAADVTGTLVSFVKKDPTGVFEMTSGKDVGPYGSVRGSASLPAEGSAIDLIVEVAPTQK